MESCINADESAPLTMASFVRSVNGRCLLPARRSVLSSTLPSLDSFVSRSRPSMGLATKRALSTSVRRTAREWLEQQQFVKMLRVKEQKMNVQQMEAAKKYDRFRPINAVLALMGLTAGSYASHATETKKRLNPLDRQGHQDALTAWTRAGTAVAVGVGYDVYSSATTIGTHLPILTASSAVFGYFGYKIVKSACEALGLAGGGKQVEEEVEGK